MFEIQKGIDHSEAIKEMLWAGNDRRANDKFFEGLELAISELKNLQHAEMLVMDEFAKEFEDATA